MIKVKQLLMDALSSHRLLPTKRALSKRVLKKGLISGTNCTSRQKRRKKGLIGIEKKLIWKSKEINTPSNRIFLKDLNHHQKRMKKRKKSLNSTRAQRKK
jgi:hypothetical protein